MGYSRLLPRPLNRDEVLLIGGLVLARMHWAADRVWLAANPGKASLPYLRELSHELLTLQDVMEWLSPVIEAMQGKDPSWGVGPELIKALLGFLEMRREELKGMMQEADPGDSEGMNAMRLEDEVLKCLPQEIEQVLETGEPLAVEGTLGFKGSRDYVLFCTAMALEMEKHAKLRQQAMVDAALGDEPPDQNWHIRTWLN